MARTPPERTPAQQKEHERRVALLALDIAQMRAWAEIYTTPLLGDDRTVLISMHETRVLDKTMPRALRNESVAWLKQEHGDSEVLDQIRRFPSEFRELAESKARES